ncbi:apolipoprotein N-acyltransferase [Saccharomonospora piscinae]|uniref:Apolipoprotein N-acyltransferase n=1 Tax=Saccharomonospora piscinae TaxID=687388 RepID=A0A1V9AC00_SACPI|nr:apolipoprotein N-acyltransferase [Saccharomonospora piscinae]OQO94603.1 apolipoprotein N-acyltransferase [Saccharomonospora piscinae]
MRRTRGHRWAGRAAALLAGALVALALPGAGLGWLAWCGLVPMLLLLARAESARDAAWRGWAAAVGFTLVAHHWLVPHLGVFTVPALAVAGLFWLPFGIAAHAVLRAPLTTPRAALALVWLPCVWVVLEVVRSWHHLGGTWALLGLSQWQVRPALGVASLGGVWLLSGVLVAVNVGLACAVSSGARPGPRVLGVGGALLVAVASLGYGASRPEPPSAGVVHVAGVQPGVVSDSVAEHLRLTRQLAGSGADVVVWGQSSVPLDPARHPRLAAELRRAAGWAGGHLLVNVDARGQDGRITKATHHYRPDGLAGTYRKQRLAPFGEYVPLRPLLGPLLGHTDAPEVDRASGAGLTLLAVDGVRLGPLISYESTFPDLRRALAARGADVTVVQGSLTTFHGSWAQRQQAAAEAVRAAESGRAAVLVNSSGTSAAFDALGRPLAWHGPGERGAFVVTVPRHTGLPPYVRWGDTVPVLAAVVAVAGVVALARPPRSLLLPCAVRANRGWRRGPARSENTPHGPAP